jgi:hypothetical protein
MKRLLLIILLLVAIYFLLPETAQGKVQGWYKLYRGWADEKALDRLIEQGKVVPVQQM